MPIASNRYKVRGEWRKFYNEELHNLCSIPSVIRSMKSRRMRLAGHVVCMGEMRNAYKDLLKTWGEGNIWNILIVLR
jgi:hypothetical protein